MRQHTDILAKAAAAGDINAFGELVAQHYPLVRGVAFRRVGDWDVSEDLAQETLLAAHANLDQLRDFRAFPAWLCRIARNLSANWIRSEQYRRELAKRYKAERGTDLSAASPVSEQIARREHVHALLEELPPKLREALVIYYLEEHTAAESAQILGIPENTFYNRVHRARKQMRELVDRDLRETIQPESVTRTQRKLLSMLPLLPVMPVLARKAAAAGPAFALGNACSQGCIAISTLGSKTNFALLGFLALALFSFALWSLSGLRVQPAANFANVSGAGDAAERDFVDEGVSPPSEIPPISSFAEELVQPLTVPEPDAQSPSEPQRFGSVSGHVYQNGVAPLEGANVILYATGGDSSRLPGKKINAAWENFVFPRWGQMNDPGHTFHAVTNSTGYFEIAAIPYGGKARIEAYSRGYHAEGHNVEVVLGEAVTTTIELESSSFVEGKLVSPSGEPVTDASVICIEVDRNNGSSSSGGDRGYTDQNGSFSLAVDLEEADIAIVTFMAKSITHGNALIQGIEVYPDEPIELRYPEPTSLRGRVFSPDGTPAKGFQVRLEGHHSDIHGERGRMYFWEELTRVSEDGTYAFDPLDPNAEYRVRVYGIDGNEVAINHDFLKINSTSENLIDLQTVQPAHIYGRVYELGSQRPLPGVRIRCEQLDDSYTTVSANTDSQGNFSLEILSGWGRFQFMADYGHDKQFSQTSPNFIKLIEIQPGNEYNVHLPLLSPWSRKFRIVDDLGTPVSGARARINSLSLDGMGGRDYGSGERSDAEGMLSISNLDPGDKISVRIAKDGYIELRTAWMSGSPGDALPVETVILEKSKGLTVTLRNVFGEMLSDSPIRVILLLNDIEENRFDMETDERGTLWLGSIAPHVEALWTSGTVSLVFEEIVNDDSKDEEAKIPRSRPVRIPENGTIHLGTVDLEEVD